MQMSGENFSKFQALINKTKRDITGNSLLKTYITTSNNY